MYMSSASAANIQVWDSVGYDVACMHDALHVLRLLTACSTIHACLYVSLVQKLHQNILLNTVMAYVLPVPMLD